MRRRFSLAPLAVASGIYSGGSVTDIAEVERVNVEDGFHVLNCTGRPHIVKMENQAASA